MRLGLGAISLWPLLYVPLFAAFMYTQFMVAPEDFVGFGAVFPIHLATMLLGLALQVYYVVDVALDTRVQGTSKVIWVVVLMTGALLAVPIYWYLRVWRTREADTLADLQAAAETS